MDQFARSAAAMVRRPRYQDSLAAPARTTGVFAPLVGEWMRRRRRGSRGGSSGSGDGGMASSSSAHDSSDQDRSHDIIVEMAVPVGDPAGADPGLVGVAAGGPYASDLGSPPLAAVAPDGPPLPPIGTEGDYLETYRRWYGVFVTLTDVIGLSGVCVRADINTIFGAGLQPSATMGSGAVVRTASIRTLSTLSASIHTNASLLFSQMDRARELLRVGLFDISSAVRAEHDARASVVARTVMRIRQTLEHTDPPPLGCAHDLPDLCLHGSTAAAAVYSLARQMEGICVHLACMCRENTVLENHPIHGLRWSTSARAYHSTHTERMGGVGFTGRILAMQQELQSARRAMDDLLQHLAALPADVQQFSGIHRDYRLAGYAARITSAAYHHQLMNLVMGGV